MEETAAERAKAQRIEAAEMLLAQSVWRKSLNSAVRRFLRYVALPVLIWVILLYFSLLPENLLGTGTLILSVLLFVLAMPTGLFLRMDRMMEGWIDSFAAPGGLLAALLIVLVNFVIIALARAWLKKSK